MLFLVIHSHTHLQLSLSLILTHTSDTCVNTIRDLSTAFIMTFTRMVSATANRLLIHTAFLSIFFK